MTPSSLYIHIPFCISKCRYCDFNSIPYDERVAAMYADALRTEIRLRANGPLKTLYIGGGTPTTLSARTLKKIFASVYEFCSLEPGAEVTCEANPGSLSQEKAEALTDSGVNRLSIGVQSFDNRVLSFLGRSHNAEQARNALRLAAEFPMALSLDLIYGVPGQDMDSWLDTVQEALSFGPAHLSAYELTPEEGTPLTEAIKRGETTMPHEEETLEMFHACRQELARAGFEHYEISNHALPDQRSRHNMNYWQRGEYLGMGVAAHSFAEEERSRNTGFVFEYLRLLGEGILPIEETTELSPDEARREYVFLGLRLRQGLDINEGGHRFGLDHDIMMKGAKALMEQGLMELDADSLRLSTRGLEVSNTAVAAFIEALGL